MDAGIGKVRGEDQWDQPPEPEPSEAPPPEEAPKNLALKKGRRGSVEILEHFQVRAAAAEGQGNIGGVTERNEASTYPKGPVRHGRRRSVDQ